MSPHAKTRVSHNNSNCVYVSHTNARGYVSVSHANDRVCSRFPFMCWSRTANIDPDLCRVCGFSSAIVVMILPFVFKMSGCAKKVDNSSHRARKCSETTELLEICE